MRRLSPLLAAVATLAVPCVLLGNSLWLLANDWYVHAEYARPGFPDDRYDLTSAQRTDLALAGLDSIRPFGDGLAALRKARLPDGSLAFSGREIAHMADVRALVGRVLLAHAIALFAILAAWGASRRLRVAGVVARGLAAGSALTLGIAAALGLYMLVDFGGFFVAFHDSLFPDGSWRFHARDTLVRLYPDAFWSDFAGVLAGLTVLQALLLAGWLWRRRARHRRLARPASGQQRVAA